MYKLIEMINFFKERHGHSIKTLLIHGENIQQLITLKGI